jgi:hypothetical protein
MSHDIPDDYCIHMGFPELWGEGEDIVNREPYDVVSPDLVVWYFSTNHGVCLFLWLGNKNVPGFHSLQPHIPLIEREE